MGRKKLSDVEIRKNKKKNLVQNCIIIDIFTVYFCMLVGNSLATSSDENILDAILKTFQSFPGNFYKIFPTSFILVLLGIIVAAIVDVVMIDSYLRKKDIVEKPNGDAAFEDDFVSFDKEFVIDPAIVEKVTGSKPQTYYDEEHKKIVKSPKIKNNLKDKTYKACWFQTQLYADKVALSLNGSWAQRNSNAIIFGASGSGKSRYFLNPNLLQANSNYVVTDPSGEIMLGYGAFLQKEEGYIVKCLNISDMEHSCRFNPLQYIKDASDIPVIVTTLMENTQKQKGGGGGDGDFWTKTTQALLCAIIGYLYEVEPLERRNFYNVLEMLRMAQEDEDAQDQEATDFDKMFEVLGKKNPNSYAFHQYQTYSLAPRKTALNILISTAVLLSTFIDIPEFNNLTYKDEMELDKFGAAPYKLKQGAKLFIEDEDRYRERYEKKHLPEGYIDVEDFKKYKDLIEKDSKGRYVEGAPYKMAVFLCIPTADTTYNWLTAMLYSIVFKLIYRRGETRAKEQVMPNPRLAYPARLLIDECANIGKIPNLQEYLATCRKYCISIVPIFQSFSQIQKVYGKEDANSIYANCDTTLFLGGVDSETLKIVCDRLGKESVKALSTGTSGGGKGKSNSTNVQNVGRELMSRIQVEQMSNAECLVFIRALKPFKVKKFNLNGHPNYKYTAEADPDEHSFVNPFECEYDDYAIEAIRIKKVGEDGYNEPKEVNSARLRASKQQEQNARKDMALSLQRSAVRYGKFDENAYYESEKEKQEAQADHEAYIEALRNVYLEAKAEEDHYSIDIIVSTCARYDIDIGIDIGVKRENYRNKSVGSLDNEEAYDIKELTEEEAVEELRKSMISGDLSISGLTNEFDLVTMDKVLACLGGMVKDTNGDSVMRQLKMDVEKESDIEKKEEINKEKPKTVETPKKIDDIYIQQTDPVMDLDLDEDNIDIFGNNPETIENTDINLDRSNKENNEEIFEEYAIDVDDIKIENIIPTEEELDDAIKGDIDFTDVVEGEVDFVEIDNADIEVFIEPGDAEDIQDLSNANTQEENIFSETDIEEKALEENVNKDMFEEQKQSVTNLEDGKTLLLKVTPENQTNTEIHEENLEKLENRQESTQSKLEICNSNNETELSVSENVSHEETPTQYKSQNVATKKQNRFTIILDDDDDDDEILF
jgi:type IV secretory pathway TraG/TraD family ATPase VirD4